MKNLTLYIIIFTLFFASCTSTSSEKNNKKQGEAKQDTVIKGNIVTAEMKEIASINDDPEKVVNTLFEVAKSKEYNRLSGLCDPNKEGDNDTKKICMLDNQSDKFKEEFTHVYQNGSVVEKPVISGNKAKVKVKFGAKGMKNETFELINRGGKWYLFHY
jgi:hypothetical protein